MRIALWILLFAVSLLSGCGGGGDGSAGGSSAFSGQVVKGLTNGATVSLYSLAPNGQRTLIASAVTNAQGQYSLPRTLQSGSVYLLEAVGGQYVNEISNVTEPLASPMRAVFVSSGTETRAVISAISEAVALELEQSASTNKWSASAVADATTLVSDTFSLPSPFDLRFFDLTTHVLGSDLSVTNAEANFSLYLGAFAGFAHELKLRSAGLTFADALSSFHRFTVKNSQDDLLSLAWTAGFVKFVDLAPPLAPYKGDLYASLGLPPDADPDQFVGAESTGQSLVTIPNWTLRMLSPTSIASQPTTDTVFNSRGALEAYRDGDVSSGVGFAHVGYASVAEVYGTTETAIGRWNRGYYYPQGVTYDTSSQKFQVGSNLTPTALTRDMVYAAGVPATAVPTCGLAVMALQAQTKPFSTHDGSRTLTMDASSQLAFRFANGTTLVGYNIVLRDDLNNLYTFKSPGGVDVPWGSDVVQANQEFGSGTLPLPSGETLQFRGMLAGVGGTKAVITISSNIQTNHSIGMSAAFELPVAFPPCVMLVAMNSRDTLSIPAWAGGNYYMNWMETQSIVTGMTFFSNGAPNHPSASGLIAGNGVEKFGNRVVGIGVMMPPFSYQGVPSQVPQAYSYVETPASPVYPSTGSASYRLVASTPFLIKSADQLLAISSGTTASLTIQFNQYPLGTTSAYYGTCQLTLNGQAILPANSMYYQSGGACSASSGSSTGESFRGNITSGDNRYAVITYTQHFSAYVKGEVSLLFEKEP